MPSALARLQPPRGQMIRSYRLALRPGGPQRRELSRCAWARRFAYNAALAWHHSERAAGRPVPREFPTAAWLREWRTEAALTKPDLSLVPARVFEYAAEDLEKAWQNAHDKRSGPPHFNRFDPQASGFAVDGAIHVTDTHLKLPRMGEIRLMPNRRSGATSGQVPIGRYALARIVQEHGEWFACVTMETPDVEIVPGSPTLGLDWGVRKLATLSDGTIFENPRALEQVAPKAEKARQSVARKIRARDLRLGPPKRGEKRPTSKRLTRARRALTKQMKRASDIRANAIHHATKTIAERDEHVVAENLKPKNLTRKRVGKGRAAKAALNSRILDAAPGLFLSTLDYKLEARGRVLIRVNPAYTSQECSRCGERTNCGSDETFKCAACGSVIDRDVNAAKNILARASALVVSAGWTARKKRGERGKTGKAAKAARPAQATIREQIHEEAT